MSLRLERAGRHPQQRQQHDERPTEQRMLPPRPATRTASPSRSQSVIASPPTGSGPSASASSTGPCHAGDHDEQRPTPSPRRSPSRNTGTPVCTGNVVDRGGVAGPSRGHTNTRLKTWNEEMNEVIIRKKVVGDSIGSVMCPNCCEPLAPSIRPTRSRTPDPLQPGQVDDHVVAGDEPGLDDDHRHEGRLRCSRASQVP